MNVGPGITAEFPVLTDEQVASVARRGTRHHTTAGEVLYAAGDRGYDFIVIEAGEVDVMRPAIPNAPRGPDRNLWARSVSVSSRTGGGLSRPTGGGEMDQTQARALLAGERARLQRLLQAETGRPEAAELGDEIDDADRRNAEQSGRAVTELLRARWAALERAEARLAAGSYGRSVRSGLPIPDERLEADPLAELTVQEAAAAERSTVEEGENAAGLVSAADPFEVLADEDITPEEEQASEEDDDEPPPEPSFGIHIEPHNQAR